MPRRPGLNLSKAIKSAAPLSLDELRSLDKWLLTRIIEAAPHEAIPVSTSCAVVEQRKTPAGTYWLDLVKCGKEQCKVCRAGPAHGPDWYVYWKQKGRTRSEYIGKEPKRKKVKA